MTVTSVMKELKKPNFSMNSITAFDVCFIKLIGVRLRERTVFSNTWNEERNLLSSAVVNAKKCKTGISDVWVTFM